jgi:hypothetical protein
MMPRLPLKILVQRASNEVRSKHMRTNSKIFRLCCLAILVGCDGTGADPQNDDTTSVQVFISNGHTQCDNNGAPLAQTQMILVQGGIDVLGSACGTITGVAYPAVCGAATGEINIHRVRRENVADAERLGFRNVSDIGTVSDVPGTGFQEVNCDTRLPIS